MEQGNLTVVIAFLAGLAAFFSPCHLPLLPIYLGFLSGSVAGEGGQPAKNKVIINSFNFVIGFSSVFILLGVLASWFSAFFSTYQVLLQRGAGIMIVIFGLHLSGIVSPALFLQERRIRFTPVTAGPGTALMMGMAFAAGWTPCIGPILGSILLLTASSGGGVSLLVAFSLGMALPFLLAALLVGQASRWINRYSGYLPKMQRVLGYSLILFGFAVYFGLLARLSLILL